MRTPQVNPTMPSSPGPPTPCNPSPSGTPLGPAVLLPGGLHGGVPGAPKAPRSRRAARAPHRLRASPAQPSPRPALGRKWSYCSWRHRWHFFFLCVCFFYFIFIFFSLPFISPHLKKAPDHRRQLAAAHAPSWAPAPCSTRAGWDPQNPCAGYGGGLSWAGGAVSSPHPSPAPLIFGGHPQGCAP